MKMTSEVCEFIKAN